MQRLRKNTWSLSMKKWLWCFGGIVIAGLGAVAALVIIVDPFFQYHKPLEKFPYLVDHQVNMNPGLAKNIEYDSVLLGSSMTVSFNTDWFRQYLGLTTQKLSYNGAYPKDQANIMEIIFDSKKDQVKRVFLGIDELNYSSEPEQTKFDIPGYLYDKNYFNDVKYVFNKDVILDYILRAAADSKDKSEWNMIYKPWWQDEHYQKAIVLMYYEPGPVKQQEPEIPPYLERIEENLVKNIIPYIEAHPETTFTCFYPPYSILYWNNVTRAKELELVLEKYRYITRRLLKYPNVEFFFFQNREEIICDLNNYADYTHYHGRICEYMVKCFESGLHQVTEENLEEELKILEDLASGYDYEAIYDDWYN
ncbi:MAG: hypothetical protein IKW28_05150 [Lachnospiraceae bacterium]|nr:hypothetical protein [Lachnospiraceae bacterium]